MGEMGSFMPDFNLNLVPDRSSSSSTANATVSSSSCLLVPKIEPKLEPLDEHDYLLASDSTFFVDSQGISASSFDERFHSEADNIYSEFSRIYEDFRNAFPNYRYSQSESQAIVPVSTENQMVCRKKVTRSWELVRVGDLGIEDQRYFRDLVRRTRIMFDSLRVLTVVDEGKRGVKYIRGDLVAASIMRKQGLWLNGDKKVVGSVPGVYIGDLFFFRMELCLVGLHGQPQAGIDSLPSSHSYNGEPIATSVVVSGGYEDDEDGGDVIIYTGQGGQDKFGRQCANQTLTSGNLALERSMHHGIEVRVIRGFKYAGSVSGKVYVYDGLYRVVDYWFDVGRSGFGVYKYKLLRIDGQPEMGSSIFRFAENLRDDPLSARPSGYLSLDISQQKENLPVLLFNDIDGDCQPLCYKYIVRAMFPPFVKWFNNSGCYCTLSCTDDCFCAAKNGGGLAYDPNGILLRGKPLIFECGPYCQCPTSCRNRVSQRGVCKRLEVFRSRETGWGVRSLDLIPAGAFICEFSGFIPTVQQESLLTMNGDSLVYPARFTKKWAEWGDLSQVYTDYIRPSHPSIPSVDFAMDVSTLRNVGCYVSHSTCPNVFVQCVLHDHDNLLFPRLMLFAMENIPPLRELSIDYGINHG